LWLNAVYDSRSLLTTRNTKEIPQGTLRSCLRF